MEDLVSQGVPDPPHKPFSPCYFRIRTRHRTLSHRGQHERIASISAPGEGLLGQQWYRGAERWQERVDLGSGRGEERADPGSGRRRNADPPEPGRRRNADPAGTRIPPEPGSAGTRTPSEPGSRRNADPAGTRTGWVRACTLTARAGSAGRWMPWGPDGRRGRRPPVGQGWPGSRSRRLRGHGRLAQDNATARNSEKGPKHRDIT